MTILRVILRRDTKTQPSPAIPCPALPCPALSGPFLSCPLPSITRILPSYSVPPDPWKSQPRQRANPVPKKQGHDIRRLIRPSITGWVSSGKQVCPRLIIPSATPMNSLPISLFLSLIHRIASHRTYVCNTT